KQTEGLHVIREVLPGEVQPLGPWAASFPRGIRQSANVLGQKALEILLPLLVERRSRGRGRGRGRERPDRPREQGGRHPRDSSSHSSSSKIKAMPFKVSASSTRLTVSPSGVMTAASPPVAITWGVPFIPSASRRTSASP